MEDGEGDGTVTDIYSVPVKVRNIDSVTDLPVDPGRRTPRSSHQANPGEMVEIPLNEDEKCKHLFNQIYTGYKFLIHGNSSDVSDTQQWLVSVRYIRAVPIDFSSCC